ncbi:Alpha/Beta hydrolase protein [Ilyonectria robusta]|uniref:Alpha/Beta hydrolase protein n=1 Tax=Ilyonectria robusta TaxID=1079257 RepID=UPI001E8E2984|nr:Alpha/Beta hydrolase protein [Ilyonectria robusta]KAH8652855.1 Alpha/Beta hydrolase protein [Ilyonectria robusta]
MAMPRSLSTTANDKLYEILKSIEHLVHFAHWAYLNDDGVEFRMYAAELKGSLNARYLRIETPFRKRGSLLAPSTTHVHLGIRTSDTLVLAFPGYIFPIAWEDILQPTQFRGFLANVWTDISFGLTKIDWLDADLPNVFVHKGFLLAFNNFLQDDKLLSYINQLRRDTSRQDFEKIEICGHGLGGALATLCALWCKIKWPDKDITCVTLGSPRVGNQHFVEEFTRRNIRCYRLVEQYDPIPTVPDRYSQAVSIKIPPSHPGFSIRKRKYQHAGESLSLWQHVSGEIILRDFDPPGVNDEEIAGDLSIPVDIGLRLGWWAPYWMWRGPRILWNLWHHNPSHYAKMVWGVMDQEMDQEMEQEMHRVRNRILRA